QRSCLQAKSESTEISRRSFLEWIAAPQAHGLMETLLRHCVSVVQDGDTGVSTGPVERQRDRLRICRNAIVDQVSYRRGQSVSMRTHGLHNGGIGWNLDIGFVRHED